MGLWNFISKGVSVEKKEPRRKRAPEEVAVQLEAQEEVAITAEEETSEAEPTLDLGNADYAASILFEQPQMQGFGNSLFSGAAISNRNILVVTPQSGKDEVGIVEHLRTGEAVIVCFDGIPFADAQRRLDFLRGVACALRGSIKHLDHNKFILTPSGVGVKK